ERLIPRDSPKLSAALWAHAFHGIEKPVLMIRAPFVVRDLHAQSAMRERMRWISRDAHGSSAVVNMDEHRAGIGTIVGTDCLDRLHGCFREIESLQFIADSLSSPLPSSWHEPAPRGDRKAA